MKIKVLATLSLSMIISSTIIAGEININFINGIQNTRTDFAISVTEIDEVLSNTSRFNVSGRYNPIGWYEGEINNGLHDAAELSLLKVHEESYVDDYRSIVRPFNRINPMVNSSAIARITPYAELTRRFGNNSVEEAMPADAMLGAKQALDSLYTEFLRNKNQKTIVVAHSEGNLLANLMYAKVLANASLSDDEKNNIRVVNVANTAWVSPNGLNYTHANDGALFEASDVGSIFGGSLETLPFLGGNELRATPHCRGVNGARTTCNYNLLPAPLAHPTGDLSGFDEYQHGFVETYLSDRAGAVMPIVNNQGVPFTFGAERRRSF